MDAVWSKLQFYVFIPGVTYLDHAGATLYAKSQLDAHMADLTTNLYGNPHSQSPSSTQCTSAVDHSRDSILRFFGTDSNHYDVVFTSGCTGALKLLSESFPWHCTEISNGSTCTLTSKTLSTLDSQHYESESGGEKKKCPQMSSNGSSQPSLRDSCEDEPSMVDGMPDPNTVLGLGSLKMRHDLGRIEPGFERSTVDVLYTSNVRVREEVGDDSTVVSRYEVKEDEGGDRGEKSVFCYLEDNHTSVVGIREVAAQFRASIVCATAQDIIRSSDMNNGATIMQSGTSTEISNKKSSDPEEIYNLFIYPAQSNFSGRKYPLKWTVEIPNGHLLIAGIHPMNSNKYPLRMWKVCLDAASYVGTSRLDLSEFPADFVTLSFYKMFGFPTGLGALLVRKDNSRLLQKRYFGGGTVLGTVSRVGLHVPHPSLHERLVDDISCVFKLSVIRNCMCAGLKMVLFHS